MKIKIKCNLNELLGVIIAQTIAFYDIKTTEEEAIDLIQTIMNTEQFQEALKNLFTENYQSTNS